MLGLLSPQYNLGSACSVVGKTKKKSAGGGEFNGDFHPMGSFIRKISPTKQIQNKWVVSSPSVNQTTCHKDAKKG